MTAILYEKSIIVAYNPFKITKNMATPIGVRNDAVGCITALQHSIRLVVPNSTYISDESPFAIDRSLPLDYSLTLMPYAAINWRDAEA